MKIFVIAFVGLILPKDVFAQWDTAVFNDNTEILYREISASGKTLPAQWFSITTFHSEIMFLGRNRSLSDAGVNFLLQHHIWTAYVDYNFSLLELRAPKRSGLVSMGIKQLGYKTVHYLARFEGIDEVANIGLHGGIQRMKNNTHNGLPLDNVSRPYMAELVVTHELDLGLSVWVRRGLFIATESGYGGRFFMFRFNGDFVLYRFSKFGVRDINRTVGFSEDAVYKYGEDDSLGAWKFEDLPFRNTGFKITADFYWSGGTIGKNAPSNITGYRARMMVQYVPIADHADFIYCLNLGFTLGSKLRETAAIGMASPLPAPAKTKRSY
jgi:hypothetical protein